MNMNINKNKWYILLVVVILILTALIIKQDYDYKEVVGHYDIYALASLEGELRGLIGKYDNGELTDDEYRYIREEIRNIISRVNMSPNLEFMQNEIYDLVLGRDIEEFVEENLKTVRVLQKN